MKKKVSLLLFLFTITTLLSQNIKHYEGKVEIDAKNHLLKASFTISFNSLPRENSMKFFIHRSTKDLKVRSGKRNIKTTIVNEEFVEKDHAITFNKSSILNKKIQIAYSLNLDSLSNNGFKFHKNWIELNLYTAWYPINTKYGRFPYTVTTEIDKGYQLFGSGKVSNKRKKWTINQTINSIDISQIFYKDIQEEVIGKIKLFYVNINNKASQKIKRNTKSHFEFINEWLGKTGNSTELMLAVSNLKHTTSYARKNFISLSVAKNYSEPYDKILAHELGHLWWNKAKVTNWEEWLNESFAEYTAIIAQRKLFGEDNFKKNINRLKKKTEKLTTPYRLQKGVKNYQNSVTYKGAYFLYELENKMGRKVFTSFMTNVHLSKITTTEDLLKLIEIKYGSEYSTFLSEKLNGF